MSKLRRLLHERGWNIREASKKLDIKEARLYRVCRGDLKLYLTEAVKIAQILGVKVEELE